MPVVMLVKCEKCGYENFPQHRYCGMCAAPLRVPGVPASASPPPEARTPLPPVQRAAPRSETKYEERPVTPTREAAAKQVSGPSFLGLGSEPADDKSFSYLFEDERPSHGGRNVVLILLIAIAAAAIWHWRQDVRVVADRLLNTLPAATKPATTDKPESNSPAPTTADSNVGSGSSSSASTSAGPSGTAPAQTQAAPSSSPAPDAAAVTPAESGKTDSTPEGSEAQTPQSPAERASKAPAQDDSAKSDSDEAPGPPPHARKPSVTKAARSETTASRGDDLETQGEKYLYGNGVPENCARARTNLLAAAQQSNAQAESVLGTMYATGHCATRDLPTAYRWFGRSLRQDPKNTRLEQDLKVLWNQMTPGERQLAMRGDH